MTTPRSAARRLGALAILAALPATAAAQGTIKPHAATILEAPSPREARVPESVDAFLGAYQLIVEGASHTREDVASGTRTTSSSAGAAGRRLVLRRDGTFQWGTVKGRWKATGESPRTGWPIVLLRAEGGRDWKVGWDTRRQARAGDVLLWNGYEYQVGRPAR